MVDFTKEFLITQTVSLPKRFVQRFSSGVWFLLFRVMIGREQLVFGCGQQESRSALQGAGKLENDGKRRNMLAAFDFSQVRAFDAGQMREGFLRNALPESFFPHRRPESNGGFGIVSARTTGTATPNRLFLHAGSVGYGEEVNHVKFNSFRHENPTLCRKPGAPFSTLHRKRSDAVLGNP